MKSYVSVGNGACVCWEPDDGGIALWDSKLGDDAPRWHFTMAEWKEFCYAVKYGALMRPVRSFFLDDEDTVLFTSMWLTEDDQAWRRSDSPVVMRFNHTEIIAFVRAAAFEQPVQPEWAQAPAYISRQEEGRGQLEPLHL